MTAAFVSPLPTGRLASQWQTRRLGATSQDVCDVIRNTERLQGRTLSSRTYVSRPSMTTAQKNQRVLRKREPIARRKPDEPIRRFALISDVHVFDSEGIWSEQVTDFTWHRLLGLVSIVFLRGPGKYNTSVLDAALSDMQSQSVQHLVCAGDITNLAMDSEFSHALSFFDSFGPPEAMTFCPGNHDIYVGNQSKAQLFQQYFGEYCKTDVPARSPRGDGFPFLQLRGGIAFIALNSGLPNTASGEVGREQWEAAREMLASEDAKKLLRNARYRVLVQHHPAQNPSVRGTPWVRQIGHGNRDWRQLSEFAKEQGIDLVLHGHLHRPYRARLAGSPNTLVYESGSGTLMADDESRMARYTVFDLDDGGLVRTYARVWNKERESFDTLELPLPS